MRAAWYERQGRAADVLMIGEMPDPEPGPGEVRVRVGASGINPGDVKKIENSFGYGMGYSRIIPHSDGAGTIDGVGTGVSERRIGERVWCFGAQSYRAFGTAAEYVALPLTQTVPLPHGVSFQQGACLGIPGITAYRAVHVAGPVAGHTVLVQGGAGSVGSAAVGLARLAGARVLASVRSDADALAAQQSGAHETIRLDARSEQAVVDEVRTLAPKGVDHIVEVAFGANIGIDEQILSVGGSIATYATGTATPSIPFWHLVFKNTRIFFLGSDDFPPQAKSAAAEALNTLLRSGWPGYRIDKSFELANIADAYAYLEKPGGSGRVIVTVS